MPRCRDDDSGEYERPRRSGNTVALWLIVSIVGGIFLLCGGVTLFAFLFLYSAGRAVQNVASSMEGPTAPAEKRTYPEMTADELIREWGQNQSAAAAKYRESGVSVTGVLSSTGGRSDALEIEVGELNPKDKFLPPKVVVKFTAQSVIADANRLKVGDKVTVRGYSDNYVFSRPHLVGVNIMPATR